MTSESKSIESWRHGTPQSALIAHNASINKLSLQLYNLTIDGKLEAIDKLCKSYQDGMNRIYLKDFINNNIGWFGKSCLHAAVIYQYTDIVRLLLKFHAAVDIATSDGDTPLHISAYAGGEHAAKIIICLIEFGASINKTNKYGCTALAIAAQCGHTQLVALLLSLGADCSIAGDNGITAIYAATQEGHSDIVEMLRESMNENEEVERNTLFIAKLYSHNDLVQTLMKRSENADL